MTLGLEMELLVPQLRELVDECSVKVESGGLPPAGTCGGAVSVAEEACGGTRRHRGSQKRAQGKDEHRRDVVVEDEHGAAGSNLQPRCSKRRKKEQGSTCLVTSVPDFDGYKWRKYGQKRIEGAMYPRSYYRCTRSAEQGCPAKRTVQRNDDDHGPTMDSSPKYTVVYMVEHTCTANDSMEPPPVILETAFLPEAEARQDAAAVDSSSSPYTTVSITTTGGAAESPATSDVTWSSTANNNEHAIDDLLYQGLFDVDDRWAEMSSLLVQGDMEYFTGPIRSPVHIAADSCWTMDQQLYLVNEPIINRLSAGGFSF